MGKKSTNNRKDLNPGEGIRNNKGKEIYYFRYRDISGKRKYIYSSELKELREKEKQITDKRNTSVRYCGDLTLNDIYDMWIRNKCDKQNNYRYMYTAFVYPTLGKKKIILITSSTVRDFYIKLVEERHLSISNVEIIHKVLFQVFETAAKERYIRYNISRDALIELKKIRNISKKTEGLTVKEQQLFEKCLVEKKNVRYKALFLTMLHCGLVVSETLGLQWSDIDFSENTIDISRTLIYYNCGDIDGNTYGIETPKSKFGYRKVPMTNELSKSLLCLKYYQRENHLICKSVIDGYSDFVFFNKLGAVYNQSSLDKTLRRIQRDCNINQIKKSKSIDYDDVILLPYFPCQVLRHTYTMRLFESGVSIIKVQKLLGHSDIRWTRQVYANFVNKVDEK